MQQTNDLDTSQLAGSQHESTPLTTANINTGLVEFLAGLPSLTLSATRRFNICERFGVTDDELTAAVAICVANKRRSLLPIPARGFGADKLACAMMLTGTARPTPDQLDAALLEMYPVGGPTTASLVAAGWLLLTFDKELLCEVVEVTQQPEQSK